VSDGDIIRTIRQLRPMTSQEEQKYMVSFKKIISCDGDFAFEVYSCLPGLDLDKYLSKIIKNNKMKFDYSIAHNGKNADYYFTLHYNKKQIQFKRNINKGGNRFKNEMFFLQDENSFINFFPKPKKYFQKNNKNNKNFQNNINNINRNYNNNYENKKFKYIKKFNSNFNNNAQQNYIRQSDTIIVILQILDPL